MTLWLWQAGYTCSLPSSKVQYCHSQCKVIWGHLYQQIKSKFGWFFWLLLGFPPPKKLTKETLTHRACFLTQPTCYEIIQCSRFSWSPVHNVLSSLQKALSCCSGREMVCPQSSSTWKVEPLSKAWSLNWQVLCSKDWSPCFSLGKLKCCGLCQQKYGNFYTALGASTHYLHLSVASSRKCNHPHPPPSW